MIRIHRIGLLAGIIAVSLAASAGAQVIPPDRDPWVREQEARFRAEYQRDMARARPARARTPVAPKYTPRGHDQARLLRSHRCWR